MNIKSIDLDDDENPSCVTAVMTVREAAYLVKLVGSMSERDSQAAVPGFTTEHHEIYTTLSGLFNRFYEDGVDDFLV